MPCSRRIAAIWCPILATAILAILLVGGLVTAAVARDWTVSADSTGDAFTIQAAIDSAQSGDRILVMPGEYVERIAISNKTLSLLSPSGPSATSIRSPGDPGTVVWVEAPGHTFTLDGFTVTGAVDDHGITVVETTVEIRNCIVERNFNFKHSTSGGGIAFWALTDHTTRFSVFDSTIRYNHTERNGGGIGCYGLASVELRRNRIYGNSTTTGDGGGVWIHTSTLGRVTLASNQITRNTAGDHGGAMLIYGSRRSGLPIEVVGNLFALNDAESIENTGISGGAMWMGNVVGLIRNNTFVLNRGRQAGGTVHIQNASEISFENNIVAHTLSSDGIHVSGGSSLFLANNVFWENSQNHFVVEDGTIAEGQNIYADPLFCDLHGSEYSVREDSPALTEISPYAGSNEIPGCRPIVSVRQMTWGRLKSMSGQLKVGEP